VSKSPPALRDDLEINVVQPPPAGGRNLTMTTMNKTFDNQRWTVEAYDDGGYTVAARHAWDLSAAVEIAKELEEEYPRVDILTPKGSVFPRREWRARPGQQ
jgi:hypothetical protein